MRLLIHEVWYISYQTTLSCLLRCINAYIWWTRERRRIWQEWASSMASAYKNESGAKVPLHDNYDRSLKFNNFPSRTLSTHSYEWTVHIIQLSLPWPVLHWSTTIIFGPRILAKLNPYHPSWWSVVNIAKSNTITQLLQRRNDTRGMVYKGYLSYRKRPSIKSYPMGTRFTAYKQQIWQASFSLSRSIAA